MTAAPSSAGPSAGPEHASVAQTLAVLGVDPHEGLSTAEGAARLAKYGPNSVEHKERSALDMLASGLEGPMPRGQRRAAELVNVPLVPHATRS